MNNPLTMTNSQFRERVKNIVEFDIEEAESQVEALRGAGYEPRLRGFARRGYDVAGVLWGEFKYSIGDDDVLGPYILADESGVIARGVATWRKAVDES